MAKLFQVTEEANGSIVHESPITKLFGVKKVNRVLDENGKGLVILAQRKTEPRNRVTTELAAAHLAAMNAAALADKEAIQLTIKGVVGDSPSNPTTGARPFQLKDFVEVFADPNDATDSIVIMEHPHRSELTIYTVDETVAAILADANA